MMRVPLQTVVLFRDGKQLPPPPIGVAFEFTEDEVKQIEKANPDALGVIAEVDVTTEEPKDI